MHAPIFHKGYVVNLDSGFCVLKATIELRKKGIFASALIKKRQYWPKFICRNDTKAHFNNKEVGETNSWAGKFDTIPFHVYAMKELDYVMLFMSTYGTNNHDNGKVNWRGGEKPGPFCSGIQRWFTTTSCSAMLWMTTMESNTHQSA